MHKIALAATAAITAVGLNATQTAASVRAGISRIRTFAYQTSCSSSSSGLFAASTCAGSPTTPTRTKPS